MFLERLFSLPNIESLVNDLVGELADHRSLLVLLPRQINETLIWNALQSKLWEKDFYTEEISLSEMPHDQNPLTFLMNKLNLNKIISSQDILESEKKSTYSLVPQVLYLNGLDKLPKLILIKWLDFLKWWAKRSQSQEIPMCKIALCLIGWGDPVLSFVPDSDVRLSVYWWWGIPSALDIHFLCRIFNYQKKLDLESRWREDILPSICGNDTNLLDNLWNKIHLSPKELADHLANYAEECGWNQELLEEWGVKTLKRNPKHIIEPISSHPPKEYWRLWSQGILHWTPEYGFELHCAALSALGHQESVSHRLWRGQARLVLPIIDQIRLELCKYIGTLYGTEWGLKWSKPDTLEDTKALKENPLSIQWGYLSWCVENLQQLNSLRRFLPLIKDAKKIRNELSHYRPISFMQFQNYYTKSQKFYELVFSVPSDKKYI